MELFVSSPVLISFAQKRKVEWTHIGGGEAYEAFKQQVEKEKCQNLSVSLLGKQDHSKVIEYYQNNTIDIFMNLSTTEGVPVSIMEAISCGVPIVATDVGGVSEIVSKETGKLVSSNPSVAEIVEAMEYVLINKFDTRAFWQTHYCADANYSRFVKAMRNL